ncbi:hypothetical protein TARUN_4752 [Trichoderma arundinaceum]|uniref:Uncharacterized protein n=1 Tax=Trichoderma arundinaceum TaxID=490622 RepID=A0A395NN73_TRIAR|nr:hypothetical protein TARUN_4752 [Trichoderma arundinaceum]
MSKPDEDQPSILQGPSLAPTSQSNSSLETAAHPVNSAPTESATANTPVPMGPDLEWIACVVAALRAMARLTKISSPLLKIVFRGGVEILQCLGDYLKWRIEVLRERCISVRDECDSVREQWDASRKRSQKLRVSYEECRELHQECKVLLLQKTMRQDEYKTRRSTMQRHRRRLEGAFSELRQQEKMMEARFRQLNQIEQMVEDTLRELDRQDKIVENKLVEVQQLEDRIKATMG